MAAFLGMRGTGDWVTDQRPKAWREAILYLYPNGGAPLTAILSKMSEEKVTDPEFNWWTKKLPDQAGAVTGVYLDSGLSSAYGSTYPNGGTGAVSGTTVYVNMAEATAKEFRVGHQVLLRVSTDTYVDVNAKVTARTLSGANSYLTCRLLEADDNSYGIFGASGHTLASCDRIIIVGNINEEGAAMPNAISYDPVKYTNYTQIFRTPLSITRTAMETKLRTGDAYKEMKREALELHSIEMEKAFLFGIPTESTGGGGKPERTTAGLIYFVRANVPANFNDFRLNSTYSGKAWTDGGGGEDWLDTYLEQVFRYGSGEKLALCGSGALLGLNKLAKADAHVNIEPKTVSYGIKVAEWLTPFGTIYLKTHPLLSQESSTRNMMVIIEPSNLRYRYVTDTTFFGMDSTGQQGSGGVSTPGSTYGARVDAISEEFLTEAGLELHHPDTFMILNGVGLDSLV